MASCWICAEEADKWKHPEARLCENCWSRSVAGLRAIDFGLVRKGDRTLEIEAPPRHAPSIQLVFRAESVGSIIKKLVKKELQVGRQQVDDQVYFEYADEADLYLLRVHETSELIAELSRHGMVEISNEKALVHLVSATADADLVAMLTASLLHFISLRQGV